ncbi:sulfite exporter TauE/SafE family protein [Bacillus timonensis]|nr:sulfite exporter TauE/SafE family protein [Bacillus timonensis]
MEWLILLMIGLVAGTLGSLVGLGGGIITVPALILLASIFPAFKDLTPQVAVGTSLIVIIFTGLSSTLAYMKQRTVDYNSGLIFFIGSGPGGILGAWLNKFLDVATFQLYFGLFIIFISILLMIRGKLKPIREYKPSKWVLVKSYQDRDGKEKTYQFHFVTAFVISFVVGMLSGLFGIGGGSLMVPAMILLFLFPPHIAVATSMFMIFLSSMTSSLTHILLGNINWLFAFILVPGAWFGATLGAYINKRLNSTIIVSLLRIILIIIGIRLIIQGL